MADAVVSIEGDDGGLDADLGSLASRFQALGAKLSSVFEQANAALGHTVDRTIAVASSAAAIHTVGAAFTSAAEAAEGLGKAAEIVLLGARALTFVPTFLGSWVPKLRGIADETVKISARFAVVTGSVTALSGRLGLIGAGFLALQIRASGAGIAMSAFGAASAYALSKTVALARSATTAVGNLFARLRLGSSGPGAVAVPGQSMFAGLGAKLSLGLSSVPLLGTALALGPLAASVASVAGSFALVKKSMSMAAEVQGVQASFATLLGNMDRARARMGELSQFASKSPFELPGVAQASLTLQQVTHGALATGAGLRLIGDVATATKQPIDSMATQVGRLYDGLMNGGPVAQTTQRLEQLGVISAATRERLEQMQRQGQKGNAVWSVAAVDLMRFSGAMDAQSRTWDGTMQRLRHNVSDLYRAFGAPVVETLTPYLSQLAAYLQSLTAWAQRAGALFAGWSALLAQAFADGKLGTMVELALNIAFAHAANYLAGHVLGGLAGLGEMLMGAFRAAGTVLLAIGKEVIGSIYGGLKMAALAFTSLMLAGIAKVLATLSKIPGLGRVGAGTAAVSNLADKAGRAALAADQSGGGVGRIDAAVARARDQLTAGAERGSKAIADAVDTFGTMFDASDSERKLRDLAYAEGTRMKKVVADAQNNATKGALPTLAPGEDKASESSGRERGPLVGELRKIGGGGFFAAGGDPLLSETKKQTSAIEALPQKIAAAMAAYKAAGPYGNQYLQLA